VDVYQEWAGSTVVLEDLFLKLKRSLTQAEFLTYYSVPIIECRYRGHCEPSLLFFGINDSFLAKYSDIERSLVSTIGKTSVITEPMLYTEESESLRSLLTQTAEKIDENTWLQQEPYKLNVALFVIKPDLLASGKKDEIIDHLKERGFIIHHMQDKLLNDENITKIFKPSNYLEPHLIDEFNRFMSSGPSTYIVLSKGHTGKTTLDELSYFVGPNDPDRAKEIAKDSLVARYGTDAILNGFHISENNEEARKEIQVTFPDYHLPIIEGKRIVEYIQQSATLGLIGPAQCRTKKATIIQTIRNAGFEVRYQKPYTFRSDEVESLYIKHRNDHFFKQMIEAYTVGPCLLLYIAKHENAVSDFIKFIGPFRREEYMTMPGTLRCDFDDPISPMTTIHGSETIIDARKELKQFFPYQQTCSILKPNLSSVQKDEIMKRIRAAGFTILSKETRQLSKELLTQMYARHNGLPWFQDFIRFMNSDVCTILILGREDAVMAYREMMGPVDPVKAKTDAPESIRAIYGLDIMRNAVHASSHIKFAREEIRLLYPDYEFIKKRPSFIHTIKESVDVDSEFDKSKQINHDIDSLTSQRISQDMHDDADEFIYLEPNEILYDVSVYTRTRENISEDTAVFLTLIGRTTETKKFLLQFADNTIQSLLPNKMDVFRFVDQDVGSVCCIGLLTFTELTVLSLFQLKAIKFSHDGRGFPKNWFVGTVNVTLPSRNKTYGILLSGPQGVYAFQLRKSLTNRIPFENRCRDIFLVEVDNELRQLEYVVLEHNNENAAPAWYVDFVVIKLLNHQQEYFFPVNRWLSTNYLDGKTKVTLSSAVMSVVSEEDLLENRSDLIKYEIHITTGSMPKAATNSPVWITINGTKSSITNKYLEIANNELFPFEPSQTDTFILYDQDVGEIEKLFLGHEIVQYGEGLFLKNISINVPSKGSESEKFRINKWLNPKRVDGIPLLEIQVQKPLVKEVKQRSVKKKTVRRRTALPTSNPRAVVSQIPSRTANATETTLHTSVSSESLKVENEYVYFVYILTRDFECDIARPSVFIDLFIDKINRTDYMRLKCENGQDIKQALEKRSFAKFIVKGPKVNGVRRLCDSMTYIKPLFKLFENSKWLDCSAGNGYGIVSLNFDQIIDPTIASSVEEMKEQISQSFIRTTQKISDTNLKQTSEQLEEHIRAIFKTFSAETGFSVNDKRKLSSTDLSQKK
ncbi:unnamed protein product, partial [Didymodactylos carnosus]